MDSQFSGQERRKFARIPVNFIVFYKINSPITVRMMVGDIVVNAIALDISEGGMAIFTDYDIPLATIVTVRFIMVDDTAVRLDERSKSIEIRGEVRYNIPTEKRSFRLGIRFMETSADDHIFIAQFVEAKK
jgi:c-di-GMP-binding flagellar brake protein YcgR